MWRDRNRSTFLSPLLASDLNLFSRPLSYIDFSAKSIDGQKHEVNIDMKISSDIAVNEKSEPVSFSSGQHQSIRYVKVGSNEQKYWAKKETMFESTGDMDTWRQPTSKQG